MTPGLRAEAPPRPDTAKTGALTLAPMDSLSSVGWLERAMNLPQYRRAQAEQVADLIAEERAAAVNSHRDRTAAVPMDATTFAPAEFDRTSTPLIEDSVTVPSQPERASSNYFAGYGTTGSAAPTPSMSRPTAEDFLAVPVIASRAAFAATMVSGTSFTPSTPAASNSTPTTWTGGNAGSFQTGVTAPATRTTSSSGYRYSPVHDGEFTDLTATSQVQVRPQPLLASSQPDALPSGQTMYITDLVGGTIRTAPAAGGTTTIYKTPGSTTDLIEGIGYFGGSIFVVNNTAGVVYKVVLSTGTVSTFANLGSGPSALVTDASGNLYVALQTANVIDKITPGGVVSLYATLPANSNPTGLAFDKSGILYSANTNGNTISKITSAGVVSTFVTIASSNLGGLAFNAAGNLYAANQGSGVIYQITTAGVVSTYANVGTSEQPIGLVFDTNGILYAAGGNNILQITTGGAVSSFATDNGGSAYLVIVPEPSTYLGGALLLVGAVLTLRRRLGLV